MPNQWLVAGGLVVVVAALWLAGRWLVKRRVAHGNFCPRCGQSGWHRRHRRLADHLFGLGLHVRRYQCTNPVCNWAGLRRKINA